MNALKEADSAPLSVVVVGVGDGSFAGMQQLETLHRGTRERDKLRFIHYEALKGDHVKLTEAALDHIPNQLVTYFVSKNIFPEPVPEADEIAVEPYNEADDIEAPIEINEEGEAVATGDTVDIPERRKKFKKFMKEGMKEGQKFLKKNKRLVGRVQRRARRKIEKLIK